jgi:uncharacterized protein (DUF302 family)
MIKNNTEYNFLLAERTTLDQFIAETPKKDIISLMSWNDRRNKVQQRIEEIENMTSDEQKDLNRKQAEEQIKRIIIDLETCDKLCLEELKDYTKITLQEKGLFEDTITKLKNVLKIIQSK